MTDSIFPTIPSTKPPVADEIAANLLREVDAECTRRVGQHVDWWRAFWQSKEATPQEIAKAMGPSAALFFGVAAVNIGHINTVAKMLGKTPIDIGVPVECLNTPQTVIINPDYTVTIG